MADANYAGMDCDIAIGGGAKAAWLEDPDGNILAVVQSE